MTVLGVLRSRLSRNRLRLVFASLIVLSGAFLAGAAASGLSTATEADVPRADPREGYTVVTESGRAGTIVAYGPDGEVRYYNNSRTKYFDVDPVEGEPLTVEYAASDTIHTAGPTCSDPPCTLNVVERADLSTGEVEVVYARYDHTEFAAEWHDADRIDEDRLLIADIVADQVFVVNTTTGLVEWRWDAQTEFPVEGGGPYPEDWAHINDVEVLADGRFLVSLRNQDQVVFLDPETGLEEEWTLGAEDDRDVLFEQHNPAYIPGEAGGPAVVVADSENNRVREFHREGGEWTLTWEWSDERMRWPRDADRLPGGNTLVVDTHGNRVLEIDPEGDIEWQVPSTLPYDAERLSADGTAVGTGASARELGLDSRTAADRGDDGGGIGVLAALAAVVRLLLPHRVHNAVLFVSPPWMGRPEFAAVAVGALATVAWIGSELRWRLRGAGVAVRSPLYRRESGDGEE